VKRLMQRFLGGAAMLMLRDGVESKLHGLNVRDKTLESMRDEAPFFTFIVREYLHKLDPNIRY